MGNGSNQYRRKPVGLPPGPYVDRRSGRKGRRGRNRQNTNRGRSANMPLRGGVDQELEEKKSTLKEASHLIDKNSRTLVKLTQLLELREGLSENKDKTVLNRKIEIYKNRINRRLTKFATWADDPRNEDKLLDKKLERTYYQEHGSINVQRKKD